MSDIQALIFCLGFGTVVGGGIVIYMLGVSGWLEDIGKNIKKLFRKKKGNKNEISITKKKKVH